MCLRDLIHHFIKVERRRLLARRELGEGLNLLSHNCLTQIQHWDVVDEPLPTDIRVVDPTRQQACVGRATPVRRIAYCVVLRKKFTVMPPAFQLAGVQVEQFSRR